MRSDVQRDARHIHCGQRHARVESGMTGLLASRPMLEGQVRRRITALPGVQVLPDSVATGLLVERDRVTVVRLAGGEPMPADLVVDASGRGSRTPFWLDELGIVPPAEERVMLDVRYGTREFRRRPGDLDGDLIVVVAPPLTSLAAEWPWRWRTTAGSSPWSARARPRTPAWTGSPRSRPICRHPICTSSSPPPSPSGSCRCTGTRPGSAAATNS
ncbi:NAD(P)/FAD-dependent oxidoreductase [Nonomuraea fuscirosea]|uniref:NAD(P)/FAD-dependent oxidoreductase n=1 Tax=Nonomuraea fuscirosea TaxID=1291556 RepID=UPI0033DF4D6A